MQTKDPSIVKVDVPNPDPIMQWTMLSAVFLLFARKSIEWLANAANWFIKKDSEEVRINEKLIDYQQKTIDQLIAVLGGEKPR